MPCDSLVLCTDIVNAVWLYLSWTEVRSKEMLSDSENWDMKQV